MWPELDRARPRAAWGRPALVAQPARQMPRRRPPPRRTERGGRASVFCVRRRTTAGPPDLGEVPIAAVAHIATCAMWPTSRTTMSTKVARLLRQRLAPTDRLISSSLAASAPRPPATAWITRAPNVTPRPTSTTIAIGIVGSRQRLWRRGPRSHRNDLWTAVGQKESCPRSRARHRGFRARSPIPDLPGGPAASLRARWTSPGPWVYTNPLDGGLLRSRCTSRWAHEFEEAASG